MTVCYAPNSKGRGRHTSDTFLPPIEETTASIISPAAHWFIVCDAIFNALSGREDCSLRARRHTVRLRHEAEVITAKPEQPAALGTEGSDIVLCKPYDKVLSLHKFHDTPLC